MGKRVNYCDRRSTSVGWFWKALAIIFVWSLVGGAVALATPEHERHDKRPNAQFTISGKTSGSAVPVTPSPRAPYYRPLFREWMRSVLSRMTSHDPLIPQCWPTRKDFKTEPLEQNALRIKEAIERGTLSKSQQQRERRRLARLQARIRDQHRIEEAKLSRLPKRYQVARRQLSDGSTAFVLEAAPPPVGDLLVALNREFQDPPPVVIRLARYGWMDGAYNVDERHYDVLDEQSKSPHIREQVFYATHFLFNSGEYIIMTERSLKKLIRGNTAPLDGAIQQYRRNREIASE